MKRNRSTEDLKNLPNKLKNCTTEGGKTGQRDTEYNIVGIWENIRGLPN